MPRFGLPVGEERQVYKSNKTKTKPKPTLGNPFHFMYLHFQDPVPFDISVKRIVWLGKTAAALASQALSCAL